MKNCPERVKDSTHKKRKIMKSLYKQILINRESKKKMLAVLLDPDRCQGKLMSSTIAALKLSVPNFVFVGGSYVNSPIDSFIELLKEEVQIPVVLFPGNASQFSPKADALLFLSLISGRNPEFLIGQHVTSALAIKQSGIEVISTGYILIDGGKVSAVEYMSHTRSIPREKKEIVLATAIAGELSGHHIIYLEAGSGALQPVPKELVNYVTSRLSIPVIVGGGIKTTQNLEDCFDAGADIAVVGNAFEENPNLITEFVNFTEEYNRKPNFSFI